MAVRPFIVAPGDHANTLDIVGEHVTVLASGEATEGYEIFLQRGSEGSPPPHSHPWDESFYVVKGEIDFVNGGSLLQGRNAVSRDRASSSRRLDGSVFLPVQVPRERALDAARELTPVGLAIDEPLSQR